MAIILKYDGKLKENFFVLSSSVIISIPINFNMLGNVFDGLGRAKTQIDKGQKSIFKNLDIKAPGILARSSIKEPLQTGIRSVDSMFPIGRGQRELIIGDRQTGKTSLTIDTILNQRNYNLYRKYSQLFCIYCAIGQKQSAIAQIVETLYIKKVMPYTIVLTASSADPASLQYLIPFTGSTIAEFFRDSGEHALIIHDDLTKQAAAYRQISLILRRPPGREAYPGDIFYLHSRLLERAAKMSTAFGSGSLTCLPIIETQLGDVSSYIPTNVISITDGQIFLESKLFNTGIRPAINIGLSVSRVGSMAQVPLLKQVSGKIKLDMANFREVEGFSFLGSDLDPTTLFTVRRGLVLQELLKQRRFAPLPVEYNIILVQAVMAGTCDFLLSYHPGAQTVNAYFRFLIDVFNGCKIQDYINKYSDIKNSNWLINVLLETYQLEFLSK
jgi:proton translocating ATP synthase F1 alpha subunit